MAESRRAYIEVSYDGKDITEAVTATVINMQYVDKASAEADELNLNVHDRDGNWHNDWYPKIHGSVSETPAESSDYTAMAAALQRGTSANELQRLIDQSDLTPAQGAALQAVTDGATWPQYVQENPQYRGQDGKLQLIKDIKGDTSNGGESVDNAVSGTILHVKIFTENWKFDGDREELDCGSFEIDAVDFDGPPDKVAIKALSTPISTGMRREEKTRAWEETTLQRIAQDIADAAGLEMMYEVETDIQLDRVDQIKKSDMSFLLGLCEQYGVSLKVTSDKIVLFEEAVYEAKPVVDTFDKKEIGGRLIHYTFSQETGDTVSKAVSSYKDPKSGLLVEAEFEPPEPPETGQVALINARPGDLRGDDFREGNDTASEDPGGTFDTGFKTFNETTDDFQDIRADRTDNAKRQAKAVARKKNKKEWTCTLRMIGNVKMVGGVNIQLTGFGVYSGKYALDESDHSVGGGYVTVIKAHRVLVGY